MLLNKRDGEKHPKEKEQVMVEAKHTDAERDKLKAETTILDESVANLIEEYRCLKAEKVELLGALQNIIVECNYNRFPASEPYIERILNIARVAIAKRKEQVMAKHTEEARTTAKLILRREAVVFGRNTWESEELAGLIDRETGLPALLAERDELKRQLEISTTNFAAIDLERDRLRDGFILLIERLESDFTKEIYKRAGQRGILYTLIAEARAALAEGEE